MSWAWFSKEWRRNKADRWTSFSAVGKVSEVSEKVSEVDPDRGGETNSVSVPRLALASLAGGIGAGAPALSLSSDKSLSLIGDKGY